MPRIFIFYCSLTDVPCVKGSEMIECFSKLLDEVDEYDLIHDLILQVMFQFGNTAITLIWADTFVSLFLQLSTHLFVHLSVSITLFICLSVHPAVSHTSNMSASLCLCVPFNSIMYLV